MLGLHDKPTMTPQVLNNALPTKRKKTLALNVGFNPTSPYINERLGLPNKPTLTPKDSMLSSLLYVPKKHTKKTTNNTVI